MLFNDSLSEFKAKQLLDSSAHKSTWLTKDDEETPARRPRRQAATGDKQCSSQAKKSKVKQSLDSSAHKSTWLTDDEETPTRRSRRQIPIDDRSCSKGRKKLQKAESFRKKRRTISFNKKVLANPALHLTSYSSDELESCWYSEDEYSAMRESTKNSVLMFEQGKLNDEEEGDDVESALGLFVHSKEGRQLRVERRFASIDAVLDEQEAQRDCGMWDDECIAHVYTEAISLDLDDFA